MALIFKILVKPLGRGSFFKYRLLILVKVIKLNRLTSILAYIISKTCFSLLVICNRKVLYKINKA